MLALGAISIVIGVILIVAGLATETSVRTEAHLPSSPYLPYVPSADVLNIGLLQKQMILIELGIGAVVVGAIFIGFGLVLERLPRPLEESAADAQPLVAAPRPADLPSPEDVSAAKPHADADADPDADGELRTMLLTVFIGFAILVAIAFLIAWSNSSARQSRASGAENQTDAAMNDLQNAVDAMNAAEANLTNASR